MALYTCSLLPSRRRNVFFFFSSRRRHSRFSRDWSADVCSSDLSERLADEMGLYADDVERLGMLDLQALRAVRLVVDTGIHVFGWTREQSIAILRASGCDVWLAASETDCYSAIPGQALTYKLGQFEIEDLRKQ